MRQAVNAISYHRTPPSARQRIGTQLEFHDLRFASYAAFRMEHGARRISCPYAPPFPASAGVVDATIHAPVVEIERIGNPQVYELAVDEREQRRIQVAGCDGNILSEAHDAELVDPDEIARFGARRLV